ncbi:BQ2448_1462 [Microbotryum intermedium]|uniref:BQ2448_1462 protein n=1 Tax=Microbotryum intermedium TaxID=269621 RepID=A0A238FFZ7_9BASI|nr:BQ2448_1462 [Microbotryum intermedium]
MTALRWASGTWSQGWSPVEASVPGAWDRPLGGLTHSTVERPLCRTPAFSDTSRDPSRRSPNPSQASEFIKGLHLSDAVLQCLAENPMGELTDDRIPLGSQERFESTADLRLEKLVGTGSTAGGWLANVIRTNRPSESPDTKFPLVDDPVLNKTYFLKLVSCQFAGSVIRETLFYQQVFPHLPDHLRCYLPRYHGTYRGSNGNGYAMVFENVGTYTNARNYYGSTGQLCEVDDAFAKLGIIHNDISAVNVLVGPNDGDFCLVDWGRSFLKLRVLVISTPPLSLSLVMCIGSYYG